MTICHSDPDCGSCTTRLAGSGLHPVTAQGRNLLQVPLINNKLLSAIKALHTGNPQPFSGVNNDRGTSTRHDQGCWLLEPGGAQAQRCEKSSWIFMNTTTWEVITYRYKESCLQQFTQAFITTCHIFFNKKREDFYFFPPYLEGRELCLSGSQCGGVSISTSKCCRDLLLLPMLLLQGPAKAEAAWDPTIFRRDNRVGLGMDGDNEGEMPARSPHCCARLGTSMHGKHC